MNSSLIAYHGQAKEAKDADEAAGETQPSEAPNFCSFGWPCRRISPGKGAKFQVFNLLQMLNLKYSSPESGN